MPLGYACISSVERMGFPKACKYSDRRGGEKKEGNKGGKKAQVERT